MNSDRRNVGPHKLRIARIQNALKLVQFNEERLPERFPGSYVLT